MTLDEFKAQMKLNAESQAKQAKDSHCDFEAGVAWAYEFVCEQLAEVS